jgi:hypothetical protein
MVPPGGEPAVQEIPAGDKGGYKALSALVGDNITSQPIAPCVNIQLITNDDGPALHLPYNRAGMVGPFLIARYDSEGYITSMAEEDLELARGWLARNDQRPPVCHVCGKPGNRTYFCPCCDVLVYCTGCLRRVRKAITSGRTQDEQFRRLSLCGRCRDNKAV